MQRVTHSIGSTIAAIAAAAAGYRVGMPTPGDLECMAAPTPLSRGAHRPQPRTLKGKRRLKWLRRNPHLSRARR